MANKPAGTQVREEAVYAFQIGNYAEATRLLMPLLAQCSEDSELFRMHGMALVRTGAAPDGLPSLVKAVSLAPGDAVAATWLGIGLHAAGRFMEAAMSLEAATRQTPADPAPLIHLSRALLKCDRPQEALAAAQRACVLAPRLLDAEHAARLAALAVAQASPATTDANMAGVWLAFGRISMRMDKVTDARAAFIEALGLQPLSSDIACELALAEHLCGQPLLATARLRAVLDRDPGCHAACLALASRLLLDDETSTALGLLDSVTPPQDGLLRARWHAERAQALVALGRNDAADRELDQAERYPVEELQLLLNWQRFVLARRNRRPEAAMLRDRVAHLATIREAGTLEHRIDVHFDLADLRRKEGDRSAAFGHWKRGHTLLRAAQPFSRPDHERYLAAIMQSFDASRLADGPRAGTIDLTPVFIVGLPRTGTSLLEQILSAHPMVHGAGERLAIRETMAGLTGTNMATTAMLRAAGLDTTILTTASSAYLACLHALAPSAVRVLDKMPDNFFQLGFIATLLPQARIICCTRDLRDVGASIFQHRFIGHHPYAHDLGDLGWYMAAHRRLLAYWKANLPSPMLMLDHQDWIADFDATLRRVLAFLDLPYDPACEKFFENDRRVGTASRAQVRRPINADGVGRWRDYAEQLAPMLRELPPGV